MLSVRAFGNLFGTESGRNLADRDYDKINELVQDSSLGTTLHDAAQQPYYKLDSQQLFYSGAPTAVAGQNRRGGAS